MTLRLAEVCLVAAAIQCCIPSAQAHRAMDVMESFELRDLTYVRKESSACTTKGEVYAVIADQELLWHRVRRGEYIGRDFGALKEIAETYIVINELFQNADGTWEDRDVVLPRVDGVGRHSRSSYEHDHALTMLGQCSVEGREIRRQLLDCALLWGKDAERLQCYDDAVRGRF